MGRLPPQALSMLRADIGAQAGGALGERVLNALRHAHKEDP